MKAEIIEIIERYNSDGELAMQTIVYGTDETCEHFEQMPQKAQKWLERAKREATWIHEAKVGNCRYKTYSKGGNNNGQ